MNSKKIVYSVAAGLLLITLVYVLGSNVFSKSYHQEMPVKFSRTNVPIMDVEIDGVLYPVGIFPGSKFSMTLFQSIMTNIEKKVHGKVEWKNGIGASFESLSYMIPKIKIGDLIWADIVTTEEKEEWTRGVTLWNNPDTTITYNKFVGGLGRPFFEKYNVLFDLRRSRIIISNDLKKLKKEGFNLANMIKIPLEEGRGIIVSAATDLGVRNFEIATGSTVNVIRPSFLQGKECIPEQYGLDAFTSSKFVLNGSDFGEMILYPSEIPSELHEIDGELGMSFLANHVIYFDYRNRVVYIEK